MASPLDDDVIVEMCMQLYREDPGQSPVPEAYMRSTLDVLRREPWRGRAIVLQVDERPSGYALLISFWSNELGGEVCEIDELFVVQQRRNQGYGTSLFAAIERGDLWPTAVVAIALGVTPDDDRARRLYGRLGFAPIGASMVRRLNLH